MAGGNFVGRIIGYVVNELVVEGLANKSGKRIRIRSIGLVDQEFFSPTFQRFAVRTSKTLQDLSIKAEQTKQEVAEQIKEASKNFDAFKRQ